MSTPQPTTALSASTKSSNIVATKIFIDSVPEYGQLQSCAEPQVSTIVRGMASGCGDGSRMTSYGCFCYSSSTRFDYLIGAQVASACNDQAQATSAQNVFAKYCQIGVTMGITPTAASTSATATLTNSASSTPGSSMSSGLTGVSSLLPSQMSSSSFAASSSSPSSTTSPISSNTRTTTIAVAVCIPVVVIVCMITAFVTYRRRKRHGEEHPVELSDEKVGEMASDSPLEKYRHDAAELPGQRSFVELPVFAETVNEPGRHEKASDLVEKYIGQHSAGGNMF